MLHLEFITALLQERVLSWGSVVKNLPAMQKMRVQSLGGKHPLKKKWQPTPVFLPGKSHGRREAWWATV